MIIRQICLLQQFYNNSDGTIFWIFKWILTAETLISIWDSFWILLLCASLTKFWPKMLKHNILLHILIFGFFQILQSEFCHQSWWQLNSSRIAVTILCTYQSSRLPLSQGKVKWRNCRLTIKTSKLVGLFLQLNNH